MCLSNEIVTVIYNTYKTPPLLLLVHLLAKKGDAGKYANDDQLGFYQVSNKICIWYCAQ